MPSTPRKPLHDQANEPSEVGHIRPRPGNRHRLWLLVLAGLLGAALWRVAAQVGGPGVDLVGWRTDAVAAFAEATQTGRPVFIDFFAHWCAPCVMLDKHTFSDTRVAETLRSRFVPLRVNVDQKANMPWVERYSGPFLPTLAIVDSRGVLITRRDGFIDAKSMQAWLDAAIPGS